jgi:hypothetical protein
MNKKKKKLAHRDTKKTPTNKIHIAISGSSKTLIAA